MSDADELLIESVREYVILYDPHNRFYHDNIRKKNAWIEISKKTGSSVIACKRRWTVLRDAFRKSLKKRKTVVGQANTATKEWKYEDLMAFMIPFYSERGQKSNLEAGDENFDDNSTTFSDAENVTDSSQDPLYERDVTSQLAVTPEYTKLIKPENVSPAQVLNHYYSNQQSSEVVKKSDHLQKFFDAMQETVRTFALPLQIEIKSKISTLVSEYEMKNLLINQFPSGTPSTPVQAQVCRVKTE